MSTSMIGILGLAAVAACWILAAVLYRVGSEGTMARRLSLLLLIEGLTLITAEFPELALGIGPEFWERHPVLLTAATLAHHLADAGMIILYPLFLHAALRTGPTRLLASRGTHLVISAIAILLAIATVVPVPFWDVQISTMLLYILVLLLFVYALVASIHAWRIAKPGVARTTAGLFAIAFGIRDACWGFAYAGSFWGLWTGTESEVSWLYLSVKTVYAFGTLFAVPLIAYGILRGLLFDIDLKLRWTIKQSTLAGLFVALIFVISEGANQFLAEELGALPGLLAAAVVMFFLAPLQRFADRIASVAMPNTENTPEYLAFRKMQVYETAVAEALAEGGISAKERSLLMHLRASLGVSESDAEAIERELVEHGQVATQSVGGVA